jgi:hypothetical protein
MIFHITMASKKRIRTYVIDGAWVIAGLLSFAALGVILAWRG